MAYTTIAVLRAMDGLDDATTYPDAALTAAIAQASVDIDRYTGSAWEYTVFEVTLTGNNSSTIQLKDYEGRVTLFPHTLTSCVIDGTSQDVSCWALYPSGVIARDSGSFGYTAPGRNITVSGTAGATSTAPADIVWATEQLARHKALGLKSRIPDRALSIQNDLGTVRLSTPAPNRATGLPEIDAVLERRRHRIGTVA